jgi:PAS domain S-box-containing protein
LLPLLRLALSGISGAFVLYAGFTVLFEDCCAVSARFAAISGEMAEHIRTLDWSKSPLGAPNSWSPALVSAVSLMLPARAEIVMFWGPEYVALYNDAYFPTIGDKHPRALGRPARENWSELWDDLEPLLRGVRETGETFFAKDRPFYIERSGGAGETVYFDVSYSAVREADGSVGGVLCIVSETTERVRAQQKAAADNNRFAEMFRQAPSFMAQLAGASHIYTLANDAYQQLIGHRDVIGKTIREALPELQGQGFYELLDEVYRSGEPFVGRSVVVSLQRAPGATLENVLLDFVYQPVRAIDGSVTGIFVEGVDVTDQRNAETALRRSEEQLRLATENAGIGLWDIDRTGGIALSYSRDSSPFVMAQDRRTPIADFLSQLPPEDARRVRAAYDAARDPVARPMMDVEYRILPGDGAPMRWVKVRGRGSFDAAGHCLRVSGTALDVTRERETQEALARSEELLRLATENAEIGMWDMDVVNNVNYSSPPVKAMFGIPADENPPSEEFFARIHTDDVARVTAAYRSAFDPGNRESYNVQYRVIGRDDGIERWVHARGRGVFDANGVCLRVTGTAMDVTKERQTQEALRRSEELLRLATGHAEIGLWDVDNVANTLTWTKPVREAFGITHDETVTLDDFYSGLHPDDLEKTSAAFSSAMDPKKRALYDVEYRTIGQEDGFERWVHAKGRGLFDDSGRCTRVVGTTIDVTARKRIEAELHELNETLEKRVTERTAALEKTQAALQQAQKMEAIGNLTGGIAHDFNNLLQGLTGSLDLIRSKPQDIERVRRWAEAGLQAAERGAKLTAQLLAFSRAQKLELKPLALNRLLEEMRDLLGRTLGPSVQVTMDLNGDVASVLGDETQLEMSVLNLAINARDAMPEGGTLTIVTRPLKVAGDPELQPGDYVELRVSDNGIGMPDDVIARAFDPFFTTKGVGKGTGLGLSQVYGMAQQAGGTARIGSEPDKGTSVSIFLRVTEGEAARAVEVDGTPMEHAGRTATVLVIDDDPDVRAFLAESLDAFGYAVAQAEDGPQGLEMIAQSRPDILLVDYAMPGMTGAEVAARVRKIHADLPIIFASGYAETAALENVQDANTAILRKPFRLGELQEAVANALRR